ncbi:interleukin-4 receptor subunit alpha [Pseudophryne corroboree]|uniref:interleukin-4 receptor subunit alpha n=1 Tax=Pseudophryne corroboree TaxID=495146 RepID=UPI003081DDA6
METDVTLHGPHQMLNISLLWLLLLLGTQCNAQSELHIQNLDCFNDYITEMFCSWKVPYSHINCSNDFLLEYNKRKEPLSYCIPENMQLADSRSPNECICYIKAEFFVASDEYNIQVQLHGTPIQNLTVLPPKKVKPKTPVNVTIEHSAGETVIVRWDSSYTKEDYLFQKLIFGVQMSSKQDPEEVKTNTLDQVESYSVIKKRLLRRGHDYAIQVKSKPNSNYYDGIWSDWSSEAEWHNDYSILPRDIMAILVPVSAPVLFICIVLCSACVSFYKKRWWNNIPDPGKSHLVFTLLHTSQVPLLKSDTNCNILPIENKSTKTIYTNCHKKLLYRNQGEAEWNDQNYDATGYHNPCEHAGLKSIVFIPELPIVEKPVEICPLEDDTRSINEPRECDEDHDNAEDHHLECDFISKMFCDILEGNREPIAMMDNNYDPLENQHSFSFLKEVCHSYGKYTPHHPTYTNGSSPVEAQRGNFLTDENHGTQKDSMAYKLSITPDNRCCHDNCKTSTFLDYSSFADAVLKSEADYYRSPTALSRCLRRISSTNNISYHNLKPYLPLMSDFNFCHVTKVDQVLPASLQYMVRHFSDDYCASLYNASEYHSFDKAIEQEKKQLRTTNYPILESGYKALESLIHPSASYLDNYSYLPGFHTMHHCRHAEAFNGVVDDVFSSACLTLQLVEPWLTCEETAIQKYHPSNMKACCNNQKGSAYFYSYSKMIVQNTDFGRFPYALTFDISYHMRN